jgi:transposase-like protein
MRDYQALIEAELTSVIDAGPHERCHARTARRDRAPAQDDQHHGGDLRLQIPKPHAGSFFPAAGATADQSVIAHHVPGSQLFGFAAPSGNRRIEDCR